MFTVISLACVINLFTILCTLLILFDKWNLITLDLPFLQKRGPIIFTNGRGMPQTSPAGAVSPELRQVVLSFIELGCWLRGRS